MKYIAIGIRIGIGNFVADISVIGILVKTHIGAPLVRSLTNKKCNYNNSVFKLFAKISSKFSPAIIV